MKKSREELLYGEFEDLISEHWIFNGMCALLRSELCLVNNSRLLALIGAGGVGKSAVTCTIARELFNKYMSDPESTSAFAPVVNYTCPEPARNIPYWNLFMRNLVKLLNGSTALPNLYPYKGPSFTNELSREVKRGKRVYEYLKDQLQLALLHRQVRILFLDEAGHILRVVSPDKFVAQLDFLKSICDQLGIILVLVGPPELLALDTTNSQVAWRLDMRAFPAYRLDQEDHLVELYSLLGRFKTKMAEFGIHGLDPYEDMIVTQTAGSVGLMKSWCLGLTRRGYVNKGHKIMDRDLKITKKTRGQLSTTISEIEQVRKHFEEDEWIAVTEEHKPDRTGHKRKGRVGSRKPARDPVGLAS